MPTGELSKAIVTKLFSLLTPECQKDLETFIMKHIPLKEKCQVEVAKGLEILKVPLHDELTDEQRLLGIKFLAFALLVILLLLLLACCCWRFCRRSKVKTNKD